MSEPSLAHIQMIEKTIARAEEGFGPAERNAAVAWLMENVAGFLDNAIRCSRCESARLPVADIDGRIMCPLCYAKAYVEGWESHWLGGR